MISPSLLSADFTNLEKEFKIMNEEKIKEIADYWKSKDMAFSQKA